MASPSSSCTRGPILFNKFIDTSSCLDALVVFEAARQNPDRYYVFPDRMSSEEAAVYEVPGTILIYEARSEREVVSEVKHRWTDSRLWNSGDKGSGLGYTHYEEEEMSAGSRAENGRQVVSHVRRLKTHGLHKWTFSSWVVKIQADTSHRALWRLIWYTSELYTKYGADMPHLRLSNDPLFSTIEIPKRIYFDGPVKARDIGRAAVRAAYSALERDTPVLSRSPYSSWTSVYESASPLNYGRPSNSPVAMSSRSHSKLSTVISSSRHLSPTPRSYKHIVRLPPIDNQRRHCGRMGLPDFLSLVTELGVERELRQGWRGVRVGVVVSSTQWSYVAFFFHGHKTVPRKEEVLCTLRLLAETLLTVVDVLEVVASLRWTR